MKSLAKRILRQLRGPVKRPQGPLVLMYHGIVDRLQDEHLDQWSITKQTFVEHLDLLADNCEFISCDQLVDSVRNQQVCDKRTIVLTFDDAFENIIRNAVPILEERQIPYMVGVPIGLIRANRSVWSVELRLLCGKSKKAFDSLRALLNERIETIEEAVDALRKLPESSRRTTWENVIQTHQAEYEVAMDRYREYRLASLQQLRECDCTFAGHGYFHSWLSGNFDAEEVEREVVRSKMEIEELLQSPTEHYIYPNGLTESVVVAAVENAGYKSGFAAGGGPVNRESTVYRIPRVNAAIDTVQLERLLK